MYIVLLSVTFFKFSGTQVEDPPFIHRGPQKRGVPGGVINVRVHIRIGPILPDGQMKVPNDPGCPDGMAVAQPLPEK